MSPVFRCDRGSEHPLLFMVTQTWGQNRSASLVSGPQIWDPYFLFLHQMSHQSQCDQNGSKGNREKWSFVPAPAAACPLGKKVPTTAAGWDLGLQCTVSLCV